MTNDIQILDRNQFLIVLQRTSKEQFIVFTSIECTSHYIEIHLLRQRCRLIVDRQLIFVNTAPHTRLRTDMHQFGRQTIRHIHHGGRFDARLLERCNHIASRLGFELTLQQIFPSFKCQLCILISTRHYALALQQLQSHIRRTEVSTHTNKVILFRTITINDVLCICLTQTSDRDSQSRHGRTSISSHNIHTIALASKTNAAVERLYIFHRKTLTYTKANRYLCRCTIHGIYIREIDYRRFVPKMLQGHILEVEVYTFEQHISSHKYSFRTKIHHGAIISHSFLCRFMHCFNVFRQVFYQPKLS